MRQKILISAITVLVLGTPVKGEDEIDKFVSTHCESVCNGESTACGNCYTQAVELFDQPQSLSEGDLDVNTNMGLEIPF
ncbi:MAG: hypothetical protein HYX35_05450 [Proteobacteria bacterium]|nr:hypothetical protein [Pseudomonadota bacterium]